MKPFSLGSIVNNYIFGFGGISNPLSYDQDLSTVILYTHPNLFWQRLNTQSLHKRFGLRLGTGNKGIETRDL